MRPIDADRIGPKLWQGSAPKPGPELAALGFSAVVLCAMEYQLPASAFPGVEVIHAPNDDRGDPPTLDELTIAMRAARQVARHVRAGRRVLVTCRLGLNRSGLVSALAVWMLGARSGAQCVERVQAARPGALGSPGFVQTLARL